MSIRYPRTSLLVLDAKVASACTGSFVHVGLRICACTTPDACHGETGKHGSFALVDIRILAII
jgi:hypothetical protein